MVRGDVHVCVWRYTWVSVGGGRQKATPCYCSRIVHLIFLTGSLNGTQSLTICLGWPVVKHKEPPVSVSPTLWYNCPLLCCLLHGYWPSNSGPRACNSHTLLTDSFCLFKCSKLKTNIHQGESRCVPVANNILRCCMHKQFFK